MFYRSLLALIASLIAATGVAACAIPAPAPPTVTPPIRIATTISAQPFVAAATDRSAYPQWTFEIAVAASTSDLLTQVEADSIGLTLYLPPDSTLWGTPLAEEPLAVIVHPNNPLTDLTLTQVEDIFAGRTAGWAVAVREAGDDSRAAFESLTTSPTLNAVVVPSPQAMLNFVANTPNGIGYVPLHWLTEVAKPVRVKGHLPTADDYVLKTMIVALAKAEPIGPAREWLGQLQK